MPAAPLKYQVGTGNSAITFSGIPFPVAMNSAVPPKVAVGYDISRDSRTDTFALRHDDWSGGFLSTAGLYTPREKNRVFYNEGLVAPRPGLLHLPFVTTIQLNNDEDTDCSADRAANRRLHSIMCSLGVNGQRFIAARDTRLYADTSLTDPAWAGALVAFTDKILSIANMRWNSTDYLVVSTDGTTNDTLATASVSGTPNFNVSIFTHDNAADGMFVMDYFSTLGGGGWNVMNGVANNVPGWFAAKSTQTIPIAASALQPIVYKDTKDVEGSIATVTTSATSPGYGSSEPGTGDTQSPSIEGGAGVRFAASWWDPWVTPDNVTASDNGYASATVNYYADADAANATAPEGVISDELIAAGFDFTGVPKGAIITGFQVEVEVKEGAAADDIFWGKAQFMVNGSEIGTNLSDGTELGTSDAYKTFGGSTNRAGTTRITGADIQTGLAVKLQFLGFEGVSTSGGVQTASGTVTVDHVRVTLTYRMPGTLATLPKGGWSPGKPPHEKDLLAVIHPISDEETTIFKPRIVTKCKFEYDPEGDRILVSYTQPPTQMANVEDAEWFQGGLAIAGGTAGALASQVKLIDNNNVVRDLGFPIANGQYPLRPITMFARGAVLLCWAALLESSGTSVGDAQLLYYFDAKWGAYGAMLSKVATTRDFAWNTMVPWAERCLNTHQNYIYGIVPEYGTGDVQVVRQFIPPDPINADPWLTNAGIVKEQAYLSIQGMELEGLPSEANNSLLSMYYQSRQGDNGYNFGTVTAEVITEGAAAHFKRANSEYLYATDSANLSTGNIDFTIAGWVYLDSDPGADMHIMGKWTTAGDDREWLLFFNNTANNLVFAVSADGAAYSTDAEWSSPATTRNWYYVVAWHDAAANTVNIQVNNGTVVSDTHTTGLTDQGGEFRIGASGDSTYFDGRVDEVGFWKRVLTSAERTWLYNEGKGRSYSEFGTGDGAALTTNLNGYWALDERYISNKSSDVRHDQTNNSDLSGAGATWAPSVLNPLVYWNAADGSQSFVERNLQSSPGSPGYKFRTTATRVTLLAESNTAETPNGCNLQLNMTSDWDAKREFGILLVDRRPRDVNNWFVAPQLEWPTPYALTDKLHAQIESKVSQAFKEVGQGPTLAMPVKHKPYRLAWRNDMPPGTWEAVEFFALNFLETVGGLS